MEIIQFDYSKEQMEKFAFNVCETFLEELVAQRLVTEPEVAKKWLDENIPVLVCSKSLVDRIREMLFGGPGENRAVICFAKLPAKD